MDEAATPPRTPPKVFVSYAHESEAHKAGVLYVATRLRGHGVDVKLDQWDLRVGQEVAHFMELGLREADRVIVVCSARYVARADDRKGGLSYEVILASDEVRRNAHTRKFIPIVCNAGKKRLPDFLAGRVSIDFEALSFQRAYDALLRDIHGVPRVRKPALGRSASAPGALEPAPPTTCESAATAGLVDRLFLIESNRAKEFGIKEGMLIALAREYAKDRVDDFDAALAGVRQALELAHDRLAEGTLRSNTSDAVDDLIAEVNARNQGGDFASAQALLAERERALAERERALAEEIARHLSMQLRLYDQQILQARLQNEPSRAAEYELKKIALGPGDDEERFASVGRIQNVYLERGRDTGARYDLLVAIALAGALCESAKGDDQRGAALNSLGNALAILGERESGTERLKEAVAAFRDALTERTRERVPLDWAMTQNNLGNALRALGERESGTKRLKEAVDAHRSALTERTRERVPLDWANTQTSLGSALSTLGAREGGTGLLKEAVAAYRDALTELTREREPLDWAMTQNSLGNALKRLGERESGPERLKEAVAAYRRALTKYTRERVPLDWAMTQNNLGTALQALGERESGTKRLKEAVAAYRRALTERTRERVPPDWAMTQNNLGDALRILGERESGTERLKKAVAAFRDALTERTRERVPLDWAMTHGNIAYAMVAFAEKAEGEAVGCHLQDALVAVDTALEVFDPQHTSPHHQEATRLREKILARLAALDTAPEN